jgi:hypothetical protein
VKRGDNPLCNVFIKKIWKKIFGKIPIILEGSKTEKKIGKFL